MSEPEQQARDQRAKQLAARIAQWMYADPDFDAEAWKDNTDLSAAARRDDWYDLARFLLYPDEDHLLDQLYHWPDRGAEESDDAVGDGPMGY